MCTAVAQCNCQDEKKCIGNGSQSCHGYGVIGRTCIHNYVFSNEDKEEECARDREANPPHGSIRQDGKRYTDHKGSERGEEPPLIGRPIFQGWMATQEPVHACGSKPRCKQAHGSSKV